MFIDWISIIVYFVSLDVFEDDGDIMIWVKNTNNYYILTI